MPCANPIISSSPYELAIDRSGATGSGVLGAFLKRAIGLPALNQVYGQVMSKGRPDRFIEDTIQTLGITISVNDADVAQIPRTGPLIVTANHPFGALDGMVLAAIIRRVRPDVKLMANYLLRAVPEMAATCIFVDPFGKSDSSRSNLGSMREAIRWVRDGGVLIVFPAGEVAHWRLRSGVTDPPWSSTVARLATITAAPVLPVYFNGRNSLMFHVAGLIHPRLRTALLPRELLKKRGCRVTVSIGKPISAGRLSSFENAEQLTAHLRTRTYLLAGRDSSGDDIDETARGHTAPTNEPIADAVSPALLATDVATLRPEQRLAVSGKFAVFLARASQIPHVLTEIGRLREITFRHVGEGTGRSLDLDRFDENYQHLFVWHAKTQQIIGAYRLGLVDQIVRDHGKSGLYTSTLFHFQNALLEDLSDAIELGRSFVRIKCQKEFAPLMLLWKGIGAFVTQNPQYRRLFGPVSISNEYQTMTRWLLMAFLKLNHHLPSLARLVLPKNPPRLAPPRELSTLITGTTVHDLDEVDQMVDEIESGRRSMPVLLRQYLKLNAKLLGFNVDPDFGDVLDALMLVDLTQVDRAILVRYLGRDGAQTFLEHHGSTLATSAKV